MKNIFIGIDVSKKTLDFCIKDNERIIDQKIDNQVRAIKKLLNAYKDQTVFIAMENTGRYNYNLYEALANYDFFVYVVHALHIKQSIGMIRGKNDKIDAQRICSFLIKNYEELPLWQPNTKAVDELKILMSERRSLIINKKRAKTQLKELTLMKSKRLKKVITIKKQLITALTKQLKQIEKLIREVIAEDEQLRVYEKQLRSIPGVGPVTAWMLITKTNGFTRLLNPRKLGCFAGVVPFEQQSGTSVKTRPRVSKMADKQLKSVLHMAAMRTTTLKQNDFKIYYERKVAEGKNKMSVINAIRNKIIHVALALINNQTFYENRLVLS